MCLNFRQCTNFSHRFQPLIELGPGNSQQLRGGQLAAQLQEEGAKAFVASWKDLVSAIENKGRDRVLSAMRHAFGGHEEKDR